MSTQEPIDTKKFLTSFKGFMDQAIAQAPVEESGNQATRGRWLVVNITGRRYCE